MTIDNFNFLKPLSVTNKIRLGNQWDGGYVVYKPSLERVDALLSYGVGWDVDFEVEFFNHTNKTVHMHDHTMLPDEHGSERQLHGSGGEYSRTQQIKYVDEWKDYLSYLKENDVVFHNEGISAEKEDRCDTLANHIFAAMPTKQL